INSSEAYRTAIGIRAGAGARGAVAGEARVEQTGEIAFLEGGNRQRRKTGLAVVFKLGALNVVEEEGPVAPVVDLRQIDRPAHRIAEVVLLERLAPHPGSIAVETIGAQRVVLSVVIRG